MQLEARIEPRLQLLPGRFVHADFATSAALAVSDQERAAAVIQIRFPERERFVDAQTGSPEHDDEAARMLTMRAVAGGAHDGRDLLDVGWVCGVADALVSWRPSRIEFGHRRRWTAAPGGIEKVAALTKARPPAATAICGNDDIVEQW